MFSIDYKQEIKRKVKKELGIENVFSTSENSEYKKKNWVFVGLIVNIPLYYQSIKKGDFDMKLKMKVKKATQQDNQCVCLLLC